MRKLTLLLLAALLGACGTQPPQPPARKPPPPPPDKLAMLGIQDTPQRDRIRDRYRYDRAIHGTRVRGLRYYFYQPLHRQEIVGFSLRNTGSPKINPGGLKKTGALRQYTFLFPDRARENIYLAINDDVKLSGRFSHDNMFRQLLFFPRRELPSLRLDRNKGQIDITLPTGEPVVFNRDTLEIVGGVLRESPIDFNRNRYRRHNPQVDYQGKYLAISVDQRGESPRRARIWGQNKLATAYYPAKYKKPCRLSPKYLFDQRPKRGDTEPRLTMLHSDDEALYKVVEKRCGWDLSALRDTRTTQVAE